MVVILLITICISLLGDILPDCQDHFCPFVVSPSNRVFSPVI